MDLTSAEPGGASGPGAPPPLFAPYLAVVVVLGAAGLALTLVSTPWGDVLAPGRMWPVVLLVLAAFVGEFKPLAISKGERPGEAISASTTFVIALLAIGDVGVAVLTQVLASLLDDVRSRRGLLKTAFNAGQYTLSVLSGGAVYALLTGTPLLDPPAEFGSDELLALLAAGAATVLVNWALVGLVVAIASRRPVTQVLGTEVRFFAAQQAVTLCLAGIAAEMATSGVAFLALLVAPALAVYMTTASGLRAAYQASHDPLTGLGNRIRMRAQLQTAVARAADGDPGPGLVLLDLDHFKDINDTVGHATGDRVLRRVAERLRAAVPDDAEVTRLGGDEFAVVVAGDLPRTQVLAQDLLAALDEPVAVGGLELLVRASVGIAVAPDHGTDPDTLLKNADVALYHAKEQRNRISTYTDQLDVNSVERLRLLTELRAAVEDRGLRLAYQPQVDLAHGRTVAVEALLRWRHPTWGDVQPDRFIPLAESSGLIASVTTHVLDTALGDLARWRAAGHDVRVSVNVSARQLSDLSLPRQVSDALGRHGLPTAVLVLEVTETALLADPARVDVVIAALRAIGVGVAVDDYGTGHASLGYLRRLAIDELKVDRSFVSGMERDPQDRVIVRSTIELARDLGLRVVAEGIEDQDTLDTLRAMGCHLGQGYHLGRPMRAAEMRRFLAAERTADLAGATEPAGAVHPTSPTQPLVPEA